jgi:hypothetical protein
MVKSDRSATSFVQIASKYMDWSMPSHLPQLEIQHNGRQDHGIHSAKRSGVRKDGKMSVSISSRELRTG